MIKYFQHGNCYQLIALLAFLVLFTSSCDSALDRHYNESAMEEDLKAIVKEAELDTSEIFLLGMYISFGKLQGKELSNKTYSEILKEAKTQEKEKRAQQEEKEKLANKIKEEEKAHHEKLSKIIGVAIYDKGFQEVDWQDYNTFKFAFENKSDKGIRAFKGTVVFTDLFNEKIYSLNLTIDEPILSGQTLIWNGQADYNPYREQDVVLRNKELDDLKIIWKPEKIIFIDNTTL